MGQGRRAGGSKTGPDAPVEAGGSDARLDRILGSPSRLRADRDLDLLAREELRPVRLLLEYLKPELAFNDQHIRYTVVVFGSTRIAEPDAARREVARARDALEKQPASRELARQLSIAERLLERSRYYQIAQELGQIIGRSGEGPADPRLVVMTGGGPGLMEAANRGAHEVDALSVGLNITLPREQEPNPYLTPELSFQFRYFALRKMHFMLRARALVALPGGYGTLDEVFETLCLIQTGKREPLPVVLIGQEYWRTLIDFDFLVSEGMIDPGDRELFSFADTAAEAWTRINDWYGERGRSVFD